MLKLIRGDTWNLSWTYLNEDETPVDLTGCSIRSDIKRFQDAIPVISLTDDDFEIDLSQGIISTQILPEITSTLYGTYLYDIEITFPDGTVTTILIDEMEVRKDITQ